MNKIFPKKTKKVLFTWLLITIVSFVMLLSIQNEKYYSFIFIILALGISFSSMIDYLKIFNTFKWIKIKAIPLNIKIESYIELGRSDVNPPVYYPYIRYIYIYNNNEYISDKYSIIEDDYRYIFKDNVREMIKNISLNTEIEIFVNPKIPSQSVIINKFSKELIFNHISYGILSIFLLIISAIIFLIG